MKNLKPVYIVSATRTPIGKFGGVFSKVRPDDLLSAVIQDAVVKAGDFDTKTIGDVIVGCAMPEAEQGMNVARRSLLMAGLPKQVPGMTINRFCASGLQAIATAADAIRTGQSDIMIAGGVESMSQVPMGGHKYAANPGCFTENEKHVGIAYGMGITAEKVAEKWKITREAQDEFAFASHQKAAAAIDAEFFSDEITTIKVTKSSYDPTENSIAHTQHSVTSDEGVRRDTTLDKLAKLKTVFAARGTVTAGTSSQMSDGAGAVVLMSEEALTKYGLTPLAEFKGYRVAGCEPEIMGVGPKYAVPNVLSATGLKLEDIDWIELNEAFAAQSLAVIKDLDLDISKVNPYGGAIATGHPLGATGALKAATIVHGLKRDKKQYGLVTMCIGTGMGAAGIFEAC